MSICKIQELEDEIRTLQLRLRQAQDELLAERFVDMPPKYKIGDVVVVPRTLFGKRRLWPAKIVRVHLSYNSGTLNDGEEYEDRVISYGYYFRAADGSFTGTSNSAYEDDIQLLPDEAAS